MSPPPAKAVEEHEPPNRRKQQGLLGRLLDRTHRHSVQHQRVEILADTIARKLGPLGAKARTSPLRCLDVGCGDMRIAERIAAQVPGTEWSCTDLYDLPPELRDDERWRKYVRFDGRSLPFPDGSFDVVLFCDVLHHSGADHRALLRDAGRIARTVIVKDHFEYSIASRLALQAMDVAGNWRHRVALPRRYFTQASFEQAYLEAGLRLLDLEVGLDLYRGTSFFRFVLDRKWQFLACLEPAPPATGVRELP